MRKLTIVSAAIAATMILAACQPAAKEDEAAAPAAEATAAPAAEATAAPAEAAAAAPDAAADKAEAPAADAAAEGTEHTGGIKVTPGN